MKSVNATCGGGAIGANDDSNKGNEEERDGNHIYSMSAPLQLSSRVARVVYSSG